MNQGSINLQKLRVGLGAPVFTFENHVDECGSKTLVSSLKNGDLVQTVGPHGIFPMKVLDTVANLALLECKDYRSVAYFDKYYFSDVELFEELKLDTIIDDAYKGGVWRLLDIRRHDKCSWYSANENEFTHLKQVIWCNNDYMSKFTVFGISHVDIKLLQPMIYNGFKTIESPFPHQL